MERYRAHMGAVIEDNGDDPSVEFPAWRIVARCQTPVDAQNVVRLLNSHRGAVEALAEAKPSVTPSGTLQVSDGWVTVHLPVEAWRTLDRLRGR